MSSNSSFFGVNDHQHCGIFWSQQNCQNRCPNAAQIRRFGTFTEPFNAITNRRYARSIIEPPEQYCSSSFAFDGVPLVFVDGAVLQIRANCVQGGYGIFWGCWHPDNMAMAIKENPLGNNRRADLLTALLFSVSSAAFHPQIDKNRAELMAAIVATEQAIERGLHAICICPESEYVTACFRNMREWQQRGWRQNDGIQAKNVDLLQRWIQILNGNRIDVHIVQIDRRIAAMNGKNMAEWLAKRGAEMCRW